MFRRWVLPRLIFIVYRLWSWSWRLKIEVSPTTQQLFDENQRTLVFSHWHGHEMAILPLLRPFKIATLISQSKDGELMNEIVQRMGGATSRGSSSRGAISGLKGLIRLCKNGHNASMAVDGPKGPIYKVKSGVFELSRLLDAPIIPMGVAAKSCHIFQKSWNKAMLPLPFTRVQVVFGDYLPALTREDSPKESHLAKRLEQAMQVTVAQAEKFISS